MYKGLGQGYYKMLDPKVKYPRCFCTDEEIDMAARMREFTDKELMKERHAFEGGWHRDEKLALDTLHKQYAQCAKLGLTKSNMPTKFGGLGLSPVVRNMVNLELSRADIGLATMVGKIHWIVSFMAATKREDLLEEFAPRIVGDEPWTACVAISEPAGGSNLEDPAFEFRSIRTIAKIEGDEVVINGHKIWPGPSGPAEHFQTEYLKGILGYWTVVQRDPSKGAEGAGMVYVPPDAKGFSVSKPFEKMGFVWSDDNCELWYDNVRLPKRYMLDTEPGMGANLIKGYVIGLGRLAGAARLTGLSEAVLEIVLDWTGNRDIAGVPIRERSYFASILAEMFRMIELSRNYMLSVTWQVTHPEIYGEHWSPEMIARYSAARSFAADTAEFCTNRAMELMGSYGYTYDYHIEKYMRDFKIVKMWLGGAQRDRLDIAQGLYGPFKWGGMDEWIKQGGLVTEGFGAPRY